MPQMSSFHWCDFMHSYQASALLRDEAVTARGLMRAANPVLRECERLLDNAARLTDPDYPWPELHASEAAEARLGAAELRYGEKSVRKLFGEKPPAYVGHTLMEKARADQLVRKRSGMPPFPLTRT